MGVICDNSANLLDYGKHKDTVEEASNSSHWR